MIHFYTCPWVYYLSVKSDRLSSNDAFWTLLIVLKDTTTICEKLVKSRFLILDDYLSLKVRWTNRFPMVSRTTFKLLIFDEFNHDFRVHYVKIVTWPIILKHKQSWLQWAYIYYEKISQDPKIAKSIIFENFLKWYHSDRKWSKVVPCMTEWPNDHFWPYFRQKSI